MGECDAEALLGVLPRRRSPLPTTLPFAFLLFLLKAQTLFRAWSTERLLSLEPERRPPGGSTSVAGVSWKHCLASPMLSQPHQHKTNVLTAGTLAPGLWMGRAGLPHGVKQAPSQAALAGSRPQGWAQRAQRRAGASPPQARASEGGRGSPWDDAWCSRKGSQTTGRELGPGCEQGTEGAR